MPIPYAGGLRPGAEIYAIDGDFTVATPCGAPNISFPFQGDSQASGYPIILLDRFINPMAPVYESVAIGQGWNIQTLVPAQAVMIVEQEFMVAEEFYSPLPLNTLYDTSWSVGWGAGLNNFEDIGNCFLTEEGPLSDVKAGLVKFTRKFVNLPPNRNEYESFSAQFPALDYGGDVIRFGFNKIVNSRIFYEYFVVDDNGLLPGITQYPAGHRLTSDLIAQYGQYICFEETKFFKGGDPNAVINNNVLDTDQPVTDDTAGAPPQPTTPSYSTYAHWANYGGVAGGPSEIVAEASSFIRWMGNIYVRKTRFVLAQ